MSTIISSYTTKQKELQELQPKVIEELEKDLAEALLTARAKAEYIFTITGTQAQLSKNSDWKLLTDIAGNESAPVKTRKKRGPNKPKTEKVAAATAPKKKRTMSAAGRAKIVAAQKARWAKIKAAKK